MTSERVDQLDAPAEVFYRRLMSKVDDHGLYDARPSILRASLYPLRVDRVREADISRWIAACEKAGVIALYQHDGKPFLQMLDTRWTARSEPKYPLPSENSCKQVPATETLDVFGVGDVDDKPPHPPAGGGFARFWTEWPAHKRKVGKAQCEAKWRTRGCEAIADRIVEAVRAARESADWRKDDGEFIPAPLVWLNQARWEGVEAAPKAKAVESIEAYQARMAAERAASMQGVTAPPREVLALAGKLRVQ